MPYKVVVTDYTFADLGIEQEQLAPLGVNLVGAQCRTIEDVAAATADADVVITQFAPVKGAAITAMKKARAIIRYGIGYDNVDSALAAQQRIPVCNVPDYCLDEVADHTLGLLLALTRQIVGNALVIRNGEWKSAMPGEKYRCLRNTTVGVVGFGRIGRAVIERLRAFGCRILVADPVVAASAVQAVGAQYATLPELLRQSDIVTLHCPSLPSTRGMINAESLAQMKPDALLVNASRGDLVVTESVVDALRSGRLAGAAFDVTNPEPLPVDSPLRGFPQVVISAHLASVSPESGPRLRKSVAELATLALQGKPLRNVVNGV